MTKVNVRAQPSAESPALGMLEPAARVQIIGKNESGSWYEILYANSHGWVSAQYVQVGAADEIPLSAPSQPTAAPAPFSPPPDGDSMDSPLASALFSPSSSRALQLNGELSATDAEDWVQFQTTGGQLSLKIECAESVLNLELWNRGARIDSFALPCGTEKRMETAAAELYALRISAAFPDQSHYIFYQLFLKSVQ